MRRTIERFLVVLLLALVARLLYLFVGYVLGYGSRRFQVESAALLFVVIGLTYRLVHSRRFIESELNLSSVRPWLWVVCCVLALVLYWPTISFGILSADADLVRNASAWHIAADMPALRPVPMIVWGVLLQIGAGPITLHVLNVVLHGTNTYLAIKLIDGWVHDRVASVLAGLLVLTAPLAVEPVASLLRFPDLVATTLVLTCVLVARRYDEHPTVTTSICFLAAGIAAVLAKETAAMVGGLVLLDVWIRHTASRVLLIDAGVLLVAVAGLILRRFDLVVDLAHRAPDKFVLQLALFRSFGGLAVPWHVDMMQRHPWLPILGVVPVVYLLTAFFLAPVVSPRLTKPAVAGAAWVLLSIVPLVPIFVITPELNNSRYVYLAAVGWAGLLAALASDSRGRLRPLQLTAMVVLVALAPIGAVSHLSYVARDVATEHRAETARKELFGALQATRLANCDFQRFGEPNDGGYLLCGNLLKSVESGYSYGISGYDQWGCDVSRDLGVAVHQYDCFNLTRPVCSGGRTVFHEECIAGERATIEGRLFDTLQDQFAKNGDGHKQVVVKMDVEGAEWDSLMQTPDAVLQQIDQLTTELHHVDEERFLAVVQRLKQFFFVANVHFNNFACIKGIEPFPAEAYEVLFVSKRLAVPGGSGTVGAPPGLTPPNNPQWPDCQTISR